MSRQDTGHGRGRRGWAAALLRGFARLCSLAARMVRHPVQACTRLLSLREYARHSMRTRIALSLAALSLTSFLILSLCGFLAYRFALSHILRWHMEPILHTLVTASQQGRSAEDIHRLAGELHVFWYTSEDIPKDMRPAPGRTDLRRIGDERYVFLGADEDNAWAVVVRVEDLDDLEEAMFTAAMACGAVTLLGSLLLSWWLTRRMVTPVVELTELVRTNSPLEESSLCTRKDEVGRLARAFASREQSLRDFLVREQLFTGDVSHELRTPLTVLQGCTEILESRLEGTPMQPVLSRMQKTITTMTGTVSTMLLLARKPEQLEQHLFDMSALARSEGDFARHMLADRPITYEEHLADALMIRANPDLAALVLHNILDNACRYTSEGSIVLSLDAHGFRVQDTAPAIDEEVRRRMFERGMRGPGRAPGSGLGLSLVQRGCERLGWHVAHQHWEKGNVFCVTFAPGAGSTTTQGRADS